MAGRRVVDPAMSRGRVVSYCRVGGTSRPAATSALNSSAADATHSWAIKNKLWDRLSVRLSFGAAGSRSFLERSGRKGRRVPRAPRRLWGAAAGGGVAHDALASNGAIGRPYRPPVRIPPRALRHTLPVADRRKVIASQNHSSIDKNLRSQRLPLSLRHRAQRGIGPARTVLAAAPATPSAARRDGGSNDFNGTITCSAPCVLPNGHLLIGRKTDRRQRPMSTVAAHSRARSTRARPGRQHRAQRPGATCAFELRIRGQRPTPSDGPAGPLLPQRDASRTHPASGFALPLWTGRAPGGLVHRWRPAKPSPAGLLDADRFCARSNRPNRVPASAAVVSGPSATNASESCERQGVARTQLSAMPGRRPRRQRDQSSGGGKSRRQNKYHPAAHAPWPPALGGGNKHSRVLQMGVRKTPAGGCRMPARRRRGRLMFSCRQLPRPICAAGPVDPSTSRRLSMPRAWRRHPDATPLKGSDGRAHTRWPSATLIVLGGAGASAAGSRLSTTSPPGRSAAWSRPQRAVPSPLAQGEFLQLDLGRGLRHRPRRVPGRSWVWRGRGPPAFRARRAASCACGTGPIDARVPFPPTSQTCRSRSGPAARIVSTPARLGGVKNAVTLAACAAPTAACR